MVSPAGTGQAGISFNPESFTEGGGPPPPQNLLITYAEVKGNYQYTNRDGMPVGSCTRQDRQRPSRAAKTERR